MQTIWLREQTALFIMWLSVFQREKRNFVLQVAMKCSNYYTNTIEIPTI